MDFASICRTCLKADNLNPIFRSGEATERYSTAIYVGIGVQVKYNDNLPQNMCLSCITQLNNILKFRKQCQVVETHLLKIMEDTKNYSNVTTITHGLDNNIKTEFCDIDEKPLKYFINTEYSQTLLENNDFITENENPTDIITENSNNTDDFDEEAYNEKYVLPENYLIKENEELNTYISQKNKKKKQTKLLKSNDEENCSEVTEQTDLPYNFITDSTATIPRVVCKLCQKELSIRSIDTHMVLRHPGADPRKVQCELCHRYVTRDKLNRHKIMMHENVDLIKCVNCKKEFESKALLADHVDTCTTKKRQRKVNESGRTLSECDICHKIMQRASLKMHKAVKHAGLRPVCEHCGRSFGNKFRLQEHCRAKHGYEKFKCTFCEFTSASVLAMKRLASFRMTTMASPNPASVPEESSEVQVLDSVEPLVTASSSVRCSSRVLDSKPVVSTLVLELEPLESTARETDSEPLESTARVTDSEPLESTARVLVLENEPLVLPWASVHDDPLAGLTGVTGSGSEDEDIVPKVIRPKRKKLTSDQIKSMWNWRMIFTELGTNDQCVQFAEEKGLIAKTKMCSYHRFAMSLSRVSGQVGNFRCRKANCRTRQVSRAIGTWFENARLPLTSIFQMMYAFCRGLTYTDTQIELVGADGTVVSTRTVSDWFRACRETVTVYELENKRCLGKIGGPNKIVQVDQAIFGRGKYSRGQHFEGHWVIGMIEDDSDDLRLEVCPDDNKSAEMVVALIKKHVQEGSIIHTNEWRAYLGLSEHGYIHKRVDTVTAKKVKSDGTNTQHIERQWRELKQKFQQKLNKQDFTQWLCEYIWRRRNARDNLDAFEELIKCIKHAYNTV